MSKRAGWIASYYNGSNGDLPLDSVGKWIDEECAASPEAMRTVLMTPTAEWGNLNTFFEMVGARECGCLVGTTELAKGYVPVWSLGGVCETHWGHNEGRLNGVRTRKFRVGVKVAAIAHRMTGGRRGRETQRKTIEMLKRRIARRLGVPQCTGGNTNDTQGD